MKTTGSRFSLLLLLMMLTGFASCNTASAAAPDAIAKKAAIAFGSTDLGLLLIQAFMIASIAEEVECDPAMCRLVQNYRSLAVPAIPRGVPHVDALATAKTVFGDSATIQTARLLQTATNAQGLVTAYEAAVFETTLRGYTAKTRHDERTQSAQARRLSQLISGTAAAKARANATWDALAIHCREAGLKFVAGSPSVSSAVEKWRNRPMPSIELATLKAFGLDDDTIKDIQEKVMKAGEKGNYPAVLEDWISAIKQNNNQNADIEQCRCQEP